MLSEEVTLKDVKTVMKNLHYWKSLGLDQIQNDWWKYFYSVHIHISFHFNNVFQDTTKMTKFLSEGITYLHPKTNDVKQPKNSFIIILSLYKPTAGYRYCITYLLN